MIGFGGLEQLLLGSSGRAAAGALGRVQRSNKQGVEARSGMDGLTKTGQNEAASFRCLASRDDQCPGCLHLHLLHLRLHISHLCLHISHLHLA